MLMIVAPGGYAYEAAPEWRRIAPLCLPSASEPGHRVVDEFVTALLREGKRETRQPHLVIALDPVGEPDERGLHRAEVEVREIRHRATPPLVRQAKGLGRIGTLSEMDVQPRTRQVRSRVPDAGAGDVDEAGDEIAGPERVPEPEVVMAEDRLDLSEIVYVKDVPNGASGFRRVGRRPRSSEAHVEAGG